MSINLQIGLINFCLSKRKKHLKSIEIGIKYKRIKITCTENSDEKKFITTCFHEKYGNLILTQVNEPLIDYLSQFNNLTKLDMSNCYLGNKISRKLFEKLSKTCILLNDINLSNTYITQDILWNFKYFLEKQSNLKILNLNSNSLGNYFAESIFPVIQERKLVGLHLNDIGMDNSINDSIDKLLSLQKKIEVLDIGSNLFGNEVADILFKVLNESVFLKDLRLNNIGLESFFDFSNMINFIGKQRNLEYLDISSNSLRNDIIEKIFYKLFSRLGKSCTEITELYISNIGINYDIELTIIDFVRVQEKLNILQTNLNNLGINYVNELFKILSEKKVNIKEIGFGELSKNEKVNINIIHFFIKQFNLHKLNLNSMKIGNEYCQEIFVQLSENCDTLTELRINNIFMDKNIQPYLGYFIKQQYNLTILDISSNEIGNKLGKKIFEQLNKLCTLNELYLNDIAVGDGIGQIFSDFISQQRYLCILNISSNEIGNKLTSEIFLKLGKHCTSIKKLFLKDIGVDYNLQSHLSDFLVLQKSLQTLDISVNNIGNGVAKNIF